MKRRTATRRYASWLLGLVIGALCLWLAARDVSLEAVQRALAGARPAMVGLTVGSVFATTLAGAVRWRLLFFPAQEHVRTSRLWSILIMGQALNIASPARVGEVARVYLAGQRYGTSKVQVGATIALEKVFDSVAFLVILGAISALVVLPPELSVATTVFAIATVLLCGATIGLAMNGDRCVSLARRLPRGWTWIPAERAAGWVASGLERLAVIRRWDVALTLVFLSLVVWGLAALGNYWMLAALNLDVPPVAALVVLAVLQLGTAAPSSPGKLGVFQFLCVVALTPFHVDKDLALTYGLLLHVAVYGPPLLLGSVFLLRALPDVRRAQQTDNARPAPVLPQIP